MSSNNRIGSYLVVVASALAGFVSSCDDEVTLTSRPLLSDPNLVRPVLECVEKASESSFIARFGYRNDAVEDVGVSVGANNKFTPSPQDRGQPTVYLPGRQRYVFAVTFNGDNLVWKLGPRTSTASRNSAACQLADAGVDGGEDASADAAGDAPAPCQGLDDGNPCTLDACDNEGIVTHTPVTNGTVCVPGTVCLSPRACVGGICQAAVPVETDDGNACTADSCDPVLGIRHEPLDGVVCSDSNACTLNERCNAGQCEPGSQVQCPLPPECEQPGVCDAGTGICSAPTGCTLCGNGVQDVGETCDDENRVSGDGCSAVCQVEPCFGVVCPGDACNAGTCNLTTGARSTVQNPKPESGTMDRTGSCNLSATLISLTTAPQTSIPIRINTR
jgi:cysteine-rich repeat protein